jgi:CRISP-associated protein Cas1
MLLTKDFDRHSAPDDWAERCEHWIDHAASLDTRRKRRERNATPLILCGHGVSLRVENGTLAIRHGFTHYPQEQATLRFFAGNRDIPERILVLDGSGTLSFDVLSWLGEQGVALARVKWTGEVAIVAGGTGYAIDRGKVQWQQDQNADESKRIAFITDLIRRKLVASIATLENQIPDSRKRAVALEWHRNSIDRLDRGGFATANDIRGIEGQAASLYFRSWQGMPIAWNGKRAVPDDWLCYDIRSSMANGAKPQNRAASHPVNAMLNYAYAVKLAQMQIQAIADGYDPTIGIMHRGRRGKPAFIFDLIEPERPKVDAAILQFIQSSAFTAADFILRKDGVCRLSPQLAKVVAALVA